MAIKLNKEVVLKALLVVFLLASFGKWYWDNRQQQNSNLLSGGQVFDRQAFAICLNKSGVLMYGDDACPHCKTQKQIFGDAFKEIKYINCVFDAEICQKEGIKAYPVWQKDKQKYLGIKDFQQLAEISGCKLTNK